MDESSELKLLSRLRQILIEHFDENELKTLCYDLPVDYDSLPAIGKAGKARELVALCKRRGRLAQILVVGKRQRPDIAWPSKVVTEEDTVSAEEQLSWPAANWSFLTRHRYFLILLLILETGLAVVTFRFKNLYLIPWGLWVLAAILLAGTAWGWYTCRQLRRSRPRIVFSGVTTLALVGLIGWQGWRIAFPPRFAPGSFGIAVAELGEGPNYSLTSTSRQLTDQVYEFLRQTMSQKGMATVTGKTIEPRRIGVVSSSDVAHAYGARIGAEIVIWGQVVTTEPHLTTIRFYVLETFDKADDPDFPFVMPVAAKSAEVSMGELNIAPDPVKLKEVVAEQARLMSSYILGLVYYLDQDFPAAVPELASALKTIQENPTLQTSAQGRALLYYYLGTASQRLGRFQEGEHFLQLGRALNPEEPALPLGLAFGYKHLGMQSELDTQLDIAFDLLNRWLSSHPRDTTAMYNLGMAYHLRNEPELGMLEYQRIIKTMPDFYVAYINLGRAYAKLGRIADAEQVLTSAIALAQARQTNSGMAWLQLALTREYAGNTEGARQAYLEATSRLKDVYWPHYYYAQFLETQKELDGALLAYQQMLQTSADKAWANEVVGGFVRRIGLPQAALIYYQKAVDAAEDARSSAVVRTYLAEIYDEVGNKEKATAQFEKAVEAGSESYYPYASFGWYLYCKGDLPRAAELYEHSLRLRPVGEEELVVVSRIYVALGDCERAQRSYSRLLSVSQYMSQAAIEEAKAYLEDPGSHCNAQGEP